MRYQRIRNQGCLDHLHREIKPGDIVFNGNPPQVGRVVKVTGRGCMLDIGADYLGRNQTMKLRSGRSAIILPEDPR